MDNLNISPSFELWASFLHSDDGTCINNPENDQVEISQSDGAHHVISSSFLAFCDSAKDDSPYSLAASVTAQVKEEFQQQLSQSVLLSDFVSRDCIATFKNKEIMLGRLLGSGEFSQVYEIKSFRLHATLPDTISVIEAEARQRMKHREKYRNKKARYALKHLKPNLTDSYSPSEYAQFATDLVREAEFLSMLQHPNIIKLRGTSQMNYAGFDQGPKGYFLIIDRLNETLTDRIAKWKRDMKGHKLGLFQPVRVHNREESILLPQKLEILLQIAAALSYLHEHNIIFRDLKPDNVGFDCRGDLKIFDFGLAKILPANRNSYQDSFKMSIAGTYRYMAPEVLSGEAYYNLKADVYTFSMLAWQVLSLQRPHQFIRNKDSLIEHVCKNGSRPIVNQQWPSSITRLLETCFEEDTKVRPTMRYVFGIIRSELLKRGDDSKLEDSYLFRRRSAISIENEDVQLTCPKNDDAKLRKFRSSMNSSVRKLKRKVSSSMSL